jgi:hypothetical protein
LGTFSPVAAFSVVRNPTPGIATPEASSRKAEMVYKHWRPELRYKTTNVAPNQLDEVRRAATWFIEQRGR